MKKILLTIVLMSFVISGCGSKEEAKPTPVAPEDRPTAVIPDSGSTLYTDDEISQTTTLIQDKDEYLVYVSSSACGACTSIEGQMYDFGLENKEKFYLIDATKFENIEKFTASTNENPKFPMAVTDDIKISGTPSLFHIKDGEIIEMLVGAQLIPEFIGNFK